jgi:hypothetical protein
MSSPLAITDVVLYNHYKSVGVNQLTQAEINQLCELENLPEADRDLLQSYQELFTESLLGSEIYYAGDESFYNSVREDFPTIARKRIRRCPPQ